VSGGEAVRAHAAPLHSCKYRWLRAPATILVDERADGVHLSYDCMLSLIAPCGSAPNDWAIRRIESLTCRRVYKQQEAETEGGEQAGETREP
jgi:hypothetical protein